MLTRVGAGILLILSILFMPFWVSAVLATLGMIYFRYFAEGVVLLFLSDVLFGLGFFSGPIALVVLFIIELTKQKIRY